MLEIIRTDRLDLLETIRQVRARICRDFTHFLNIGGHVTFDLWVLIRKPVNQFFLRSFQHIKAWFTHVINLTIEARLHLAHISISRVNLLLQFFFVRIDSIIRINSKNVEILLQLRQHALRPLQFLLKTLYINLFFL